MRRWVTVSLLGCLMAAIAFLPAAAELIGARSSGAAHSYEEPSYKKKKCKKKSNKKKKCKKKNATPTPSPSPSASPTPAPSPTPTPSASPTPTPSPTPSLPAVETFTQSGQILLFNPLAGIADGITQTEFAQRCAMPVTQGLDAYVVPIPPEHATGDSIATASGSAPGPYDLDLAFFTADCAFLGESASETLNETAEVPIDTAYIVVNNAIGVGVSFLLTVEAR